jgi:SNF2 family DNA or RNA helicase
MAGIRPAPYQLVPLTKLLLSDLKGILIADGVGVGKTISAGYVLDWYRRRSSRPCCVVSPPGLVEKWLFELRGKFDIRTDAIRSQDELDTALNELQKLTEPRVYVASYSMVSGASKLSPSVVVIDEIHTFRNPKTRGWRDARNLAKSSDVRVGLSATPLNNSVNDLAAIYSILLPSSHEVAMQAVIERLWDSRDFRTLDPVLSRFKKELLGIHFARRSVETVSISYPDQYASWVVRTVSEISGGSPDSNRFPIETVTYFREAASSVSAFMKSVHRPAPVKSDHKVELLLRLLSKIDSQCLVFCQFTETAKAISSAIVGRPVFTLTGDVPPSDRDGVIADFRREEEGVMALTSVGSEGLDLQFCNTVVNYDLHWNPMVLEQRVGRVDRVGQGKDVIRIYNLRVVGSIDDRVWEVISDKVRRLRGSPLETGPLVSPTSILYSPEVEASELQEAERSARAASLSEQLDTSDYAILPHIDPLACDPYRLGRMGTFDWIDRSHGDVQTWMKEVKVHGEALRQLVDRFQFAAGVTE